MAWQRLRPVEAQLQPFRKGTGGGPDQWIFNAKSRKSNRQNRVRSMRQVLIHKYVLDAESRRTVLTRAYSQVIDIVHTSLCAGQHCVVSPI
jgi:hypothetical protein